MFLWFNPSIVEAYSTLCLAIVGFVGAIYVPLQIRAAKKSQQISQFLQVLTL